MTHELKFLIIGVLRVGVIGMLAFLNKRHLIESYHVLRKSMPKKMVKCVDRDELRNMRKAESRKFDILISLREKFINAGVQVNLQPATVFDNIDKKEFQKVKEINLKLENRLTELEEMIKRSDEKQKIRDIQNELSLSSVYDLNEKVDKLLNYQQSLKEIIDGKLVTIGYDVENIKHHCSMLNTIFHELENKLISLERNTENPMRKYSAIKTRIATLENDVMKNTSHIIGMDHSHRSLEWTRLQYFGSAGIFPPDNRRNDDLTSFVAAPSYYDMPPVPRSVAQYFPPATTTNSPVPPSAFLPSPPPAPPMPSVIFQPPPPKTPKKSQLLTGSEKSSSSSVVTAKVEEMYGRIPITTEILKSVVLKPPGERKRQVNRQRYNRRIFEKNIYAYEEYECNQYMQN
ncbi:PREDICTED: LOW QUALITY PROTEIN: arp2/3 complex-activating protein rickA-like [Diuraphis noxia]|uniref:LOW QUALITY PROTEIN: arp2/3 complex-activating protein rickA-like n=1 Tax=Diuraphis noxia TaxID=143948 RepID=UPI0007637B0C|nr:PREDICTED: LOW QUALITY PROTEIN: arp2/3 complex-activating protein rickA-like [Diuraphis noxia]